MEHTASQQTLPTVAFARNAPRLSMTMNRNKQLALREAPSWALILNTSHLNKPQLLTFRGGDLQDGAEVRPRLQDGSLAQCE